MSYMLIISENLVENDLLMISVSYIIPVFFSLKNAINNPNGNPIIRPNKAQIF